MARRRSTILAWLGGALAVLAFAAAPARAAWPERPITIIMHFAPGGANDLLGRLIAAELAPALGQGVVVENRPGANGNIGLTAAARAVPDGYTLVVASGAGPWPELPGVPTMAEAGIADAVVDTTQMLLAPAATPPPVIDRPARGVLVIMRKPEVRDKMLKASFEVRPEGPDGLAARIAREVPMWKDIVDKAGLKTN